MFNPHHGYARIPYQGQAAEHGAVAADAEEKIRLAHQLARAFKKRKPPVSPRWRKQQLGIIVKNTDFGPDCAKPIHQGYDVGNIGRGRCDDRTVQLSWATRFVGAAKLHI